MYEYASAGFLDDRLADLRAPAISPGKRTLTAAIQRMPTGAAPPIALGLPERGPGDPLPDGVRDRMEQSFGTSFDDVRLHRDRAADAIGARAFAQGHHIHLGSGAPDLAGEHGLGLIGHELTHVVQQRAGRASVPQAAGLPINADPALEHEADDLGHRAARGERVTVPGSTASSAPAAAPIQGDFYRHDVAGLHFQAGDPPPGMQYVGIHDGLEVYVQLPPFAQDDDVPEDGDDIVPIEVDGDDDLYDHDDEDPRTVEERLFIALFGAASTDLKWRMLTQVIEEGSLRNLDQFERLQQELAEEDPELVPTRPTADETRHKKFIKSKKYEGDEIDDYLHREHVKKFQDLLHAQEKKAQRYYDDASDTEGSDSEDEAIEQGQRERGDRRERPYAPMERVKRAIPHPPFITFLTTLASDDEATQMTAVQSGKDTKAGKALQKKLDGGDRIFRKESSLKEPTWKHETRYEIHQPLSPEQEADLDTLNAKLAEGMTLEQAIAALPNETQFVVAQHRGLAYSLPNFSRELHQIHRKLDERGQPVYAGATLAAGEKGVAGYYELYNDPDCAEELRAYQDTLDVTGGEIRDTMHGLGEQKVDEKTRKSVKRSTANFKPQSLLDVLTHLYAEDYEGFLRALRKAQARASTEDKPAIDAIFEGLPNDKIPIVSSGDVPYHAHKYDYGLKAYEGHEQEVLEPRYDTKGKPWRPYSGKSYISLHDAGEYDEKTGPTHVVSLQNAKRTNIGKTIIPERETEHYGYMERDKIFEQMLGKFPDFSKPYKQVYAKKYGLTPELFEAFRKAMVATPIHSTPRVQVEALLSKYLVMYDDLCALQAAGDEATERGAALVYRTNFRQFGRSPVAFTPPKAAKTKPTDDEAPKQRKTKAKAKAKAPKNATPSKRGAPEKTKKKQVFKPPPEERSKNKRDRSEDTEEKKRVKKKKRFK